MKVHLPAGWISLLRLALCVAGLAALPVRLRAAVTVSLSQSPAMATVTNGLPVTVDAIVTANAGEVVTGCDLVFRTLAIGTTNWWNTNAMSFVVGGGVWRGVIPRLPQGSVEYHVIVRYTGGDGGPAISATTNYTISSTLDHRRQTDFSGWTQEGTTSNFFRTVPGSDGSEPNRWYASGVFIGMPGAPIGERPRFDGALTPSPYGYIRSIRHSFIRSPHLAEGVGTLYFVSCMRADGRTATVAVQVTASHDPNLGWQTVQTLNYSGTNQVATPVVINRRDARYLRLLRTDDTYLISDSTLPGAAVYDNLAISIPPADVALAPAAVPISPAEPVTQQAVTVRCTLSDVDSHVPTINRRIRFHYRWNTDPWTFIDLAHESGSTYVGNLPGMGAGTNQYFFSCDFDGYFYRLDPDGTGPESNRIERIGRRVTATNSYTIVAEHTRILGFSTNLVAFGDVPIDRSRAIPLTLLNSGNSSLTVTGIHSSDSRFSVTPTHFTLAAFGSSNVTVTFTPGVLGDYSGVLTVHSDRTAGTNQVNLSGTGSPIEVVSIPTGITPDVAAGARLAMLSFTASGATNNYPARGVQYRFDWGNGVTSAWGSATQTNSWSTTSVFNISAQARSPQDTSKVSDWSGTLASVTITNTRILALSGNLAFGNVVTNTSPQRTVVVSNSVHSSDALTVSQIVVSMGAATVTPTAFVLPVGARTNVTVTFAPTLLGDYSGVLTVLADSTSGAFTLPMSGTGIVVEAVSVPTAIAGPSAGARQAMLSFTASGAINTHAIYGHGVQYRFDWGNGVTSAWGSATQSNSWNTTNVFHIGAQARSLQTPAIVSPWSGALASVTVTNTRILALSGNLAFGHVVTNTSLHRTVVVSNSVNSSDALTVSQITASMGAVTVTPTAFVLPVGAGTNVTVTFAPTLPGGYGGTLTVLANQTSGAFALPMSGTGIVAEAVTMLSFDGPRNASTNEWVSYTALATNNWAGYHGHGVQYRFDWGDGRTSGWASASTATSRWAVTGSYALRAQARSSSNLAVVSAWHPLPSLLTIRAAPVVAFANVNSGLPTPVTVTLGGLHACTLYYSPAGSTLFQALPLTSSGGGVWTGAIPPINPGPMRYYVQYTIGGPVTIEWPNHAPYPTHVISASLGDRRYTDFSGWTQEGTTSNYFRNVPGSDGSEPNRWYASGVFIGQPGPPIGERPRFDGVFTPQPFGYIHSIRHSFIRSPHLAEGVGTLYFVSCMRAAHTATIAVQITVADDPSFGWQTVQTLNYSGATQVATPVVINRRDVRYVRLLRTDDTYLVAGSTLPGAVVYDNISISIPPTDATIIERLRNPGYPARDQDVLVRCVVTDVSTNFPSVNRRVVCYYSWQSATGPWTATNMTHQGNNLYHGTIPQHEIGRMFYFFRCYFDGYSYTLDPDGSGPQAIRHEAIAVAALPTNAPTAIRPPYEIRRYRSMFSGMAIDTYPSSVRVGTNDVTLVGDYTWQGLTLVKGITNLAWRFKGYHAYTNNAETFDPIPWFLGDDDQDSLHPPIGGKIEYPGANDIRADLDYDGFLLFRVNTDPHFRDYIVKRAVYQNFDTPFWQASPNYFEESLGLYAMQTFANNFDVWNEDAYPSGDYRASNLELLAGVVGQDYVAPPGFFAGAQSWAYQSGKAVADRAFISPHATPNTALALCPDSRGLVWSTSEGFTPGVHSFSFDARARVEDTYFALFTGESGNNPFTGSAWTTNYVATATLSAQQMSPAQAYISTLVHYQPAFFGAGPGSFYEVRLIQDTDVDFSDNRVAVRLFRWNEGSTVPTEIASSPTGPGLSPNNFDGQRLTTGEKSIEIRVSITNLMTRLDVRLDWTGSATNWMANPIRFDDTSGLRLTRGGSVGFMTFDTVPVISRLAVGTIPGGADMLPAVTNWSGDARWFMGGRRHDNQHRWQIDPTGRLWRPLPPLRLGVYTAPGIDDLNQPNFSDLVPRREVTGLTLVNTPVTVTLNAWDRTFVALQNSATNAARTLNDLPIVVDNLTLSPWRARTRSFSQMPTTVYRRWTSWDQQFAWLNAEKSWAVLEGWVDTTPGSSANEVQFQRSRANPGLVQAVVSPVLTNGIGSIAFNHRAINGQVVFAIERTASSGDQSDYNVGFPLRVVTNSSSAETPFFLPIRELFTGRVRVRLLPQSDPNAILKIDDLLVRDYPPRDETTWQAYNVLITSTQTNRIWEGQTGFLNNSVNLGTAGSANINSAGTEVLFEHRPFIQSPEVGTGIGEIGFWYRVWDTNAVGRLELKVAPRLDSPEAQWISLTNFTFTHTDFRYFRIEPYDLQNRVLRIHGYTNGPNRVVIDNILMTEPVRTGYEIRSVRLIPAQPLENQAVDVEVEIGRFIMNPSNIQVFVSYRPTTMGVWGYTNWWTRTDTPGSRRVELVEISPRRYRTTGAARIPAFPVDTPVQFVAWGTHADLAEDAPKIFQPTNAFTNPTWYYPRDMNSPPGGLADGLGNQGWSPYYFVYSCAPGAVWVNEFNYFRIAADAGFEYVELVGPANTLIGNWRIDSIDVNNPNIVRDSCTITNGIRLPNDGDGWGFFVWGDPTVTNVDHTFTTPVQQNLPQSGGIRLVRSMGAWEQRLAYGPSRANLFPHGYADAGSKPLSSIPQVLSLLGAGNAYTNFTWTLLSGAASRTPGRINVSQIFLPVFHIIHSVIGENGAHSVGTERMVAVEIARGGSTQIVYTANQWFRIASFSANAVPVPEAVGRTNYVWSIVDAQSDHSNRVTFAAATSGEAGIPLSVPPAWARNYYATETAARSDLSLATDYLLNLNPTVAYDINLAFREVSVNGNVVSKAIILTDGATRLTTTINGVLKLQGKVSLADPVWTDIGGATFNRASFNNGTNTLNITDTTNNFFRAVIVPL